jgi:precorrin-2 dehydrogenase/sirohydrochlorin ferrochelatase
MFPIVLDLSRMPVILAGNGPQAARRLMLLDQGRAGRVTVCAPAPGDALASAAGSRLVRRWPTADEIACAKLLLIADGIAAGVLADLVAAARAASTLVNVEDRPELSDFHSPAMVRRGDLLVTVSTGGRSPALARRLGRFLAEVFGPEWQARLDDLAALRSGWRERGADSSMIRTWTEAWLDRHGELPTEAEAAATLLRHMGERTPAAAS